MKRYKLIKTYPDSPELGTIIERECRHYCIDKNTHLRYPNIENYPEFWEEIVEKDYEIKTFGYERGVDRTLDEYLKYSLVTGEVRDSKGADRLIDLIGTTPYYIKSVKRLSDGVTFTIGDTCNPTGTGYKYNKRPITKIWFTDGGSLRISSENYTLPISGIEHSKMPIFTSEDGVDMYEGDKYYFVPPEHEGKVYIHTAKEAFAISEYGKRFSTKKAAENYIFNSEKRFSINDVIDAMPLDSDDVTFTLTKMLDNLKNLTQTTKE